MCRLSLRSPAPLLATLLALGGGLGAHTGCSAQRPQFWGFTGPWDAGSDRSVRAHAAQLDAVISGWITIDSVTGQPILPSPYPDTVLPRTATRMAIVTSWHEDRFHAASIRALGRSTEALGRAAGALARYAAGAEYDGLVFDFETLERADLDAHLRVLRALADSARAHGIGTLAAAVAATDTAAYPAAPLLAVVDALVVMLYDQHWLGSEPGPISDPAWFRRSLRLRLEEVGSDRLIAGLPLYGYRWRPGQPTESVTFAEAQAHAATARAPLQRDPASRTLRSAAPDGEETWVTDAGLLRILIDDARAAGVNRFALWRLGQEDPAIWTSVIR
jgi:spore germination protein YaaH